MLRPILIALLTLSAPTLVQAMPLLPQNEKAAVHPVAPQCTRHRRKFFVPAEGWLVKTVFVACKTIVAATNQTDKKSDVSLPSDSSGKSR
jgi:hypothetical protein